MRCRACSFRLKRCCAQLAVTALVTLMLCYVAYIQEPVSPITEAEAAAIAARNRLAYSKRFRVPASRRQEAEIFGGRNSSKRPPRKPVVAIIHQSWSDKGLPPLFAHWSASFDACFPGYKRILWTDADNRDLIARHYPWFLARYDSLSPGVQRADVSRLFYMHKFGGIYCDLDCECLTGFQHLLSNTSLALGAMEGSLITQLTNPSFVAEGQVENSFMYSRPGHPFFWNLILKLNATQGGLTIMETGTYLLMSGIKEARTASQDRGLFDGLPYLTIYPASMFNPYSWIHFSRHPNCRLFGDLTPDLLDRCRQSFSKTSYIIQYHTQVWDKGKAYVLRRSVQAATTAPAHS